MSTLDLPYELLSLDILNSIDDSIKNPFKGLFNTLNEIIKDGQDRARVLQRRLGRFDDWSVQENNCVLLINDITKKCQTKVAMKDALDVWNHTRVHLSGNINLIKDAMAAVKLVGDWDAVLKRQQKKMDFFLHLLIKLNKHFEKLTTKYKKKCMQEGDYSWCGVEG